MPCSSYHAPTFYLRGLQLLLGVPVCTCLFCVRPLSATDGWIKCFSAIRIIRCTYRCEPEQAPLKIALLLSGGVDSSLALKLLLAAGHDVTAFYLQVPSFALSLRALAPCVPEIYKLLHSCLAVSEQNGQPSLTGMWCEQIWFQEDFRNYWDACPWEEDLAICQQVSPQSFVMMQQTLSSLRGWNTTFLDFDPPEI
jgi:hypothetical protein